MLIWIFKYVYVARIAGVDLGLELDPGVVQLHKGLFFLIILDEMTTGFSCLMGQCSCFVCFLDCSITGRDMPLLCVWASVILHFFFLILMIIYVILLI